MLGVAEKDGFSWWKYVLIALKPVEYSLELWLVKWTSYHYALKLINVESSTTKQRMKSYGGHGISVKTVNSANHCRCNDVSIKDTSLQDDLVRRKATSYLMAVKGLFKQRKWWSVSIGSLFQLTLNSNPIIYDNISVSLFYGLLYKHPLT